MPFPWPATPPEIAHQLLSSGDQAESFLATSVALKELAALMGVDAASMSSNAAATAPSFVGLGGIKSLVSASTYAPLAATGSGWLAGGSGVVDTLASSYTLAKNTMIPAPVALATRESAESWAAANWHGFFTPIVTSLYELYGNQWATNAAAGTGWETAVFGAAGPLAVPAPVAPVMANPAGMASEAAMVAQNGVENPTSAAMRRSFSGVQEALTKTAGVPGGPGMESVTSLFSLASTPMQMFGQVPQMFGQLPQTLGQFPQMGFGLLGPLLSGNALAAANPANALASTTEAARQAAATQSLSNAGLPGGGGAAIGGPGSGTTAPLSTFSRPAASFGPVPNAAPRVAPAPGAATGGASGPTAGTPGGGGLFAPAAANQNRRDANGNPTSHPTTVTFDDERND